MEALTDRPASFVDRVIFPSTLPTTFWPWLLQLTLSPLRNVFMNRVYPRTANYPLAGKKPDVTEGFALGFAWLEFGLLVGLLAARVLRRR